MKSFATAILVFGLATLSGCGTPPGASAYGERGTPESLIDASSEVVNLAIVDSADVKQLVSWIEKDRPSRAEIHCVASQKSCAAARKALEVHGVAVTDAVGEDTSVTLVYDRLVARDCDPRFVSNHHNFYNTNHSGFGCAVASNMVQHITDKQEIVSPALSGNPSAVRAVNDYKRAYKPRPVVEPYSIGDSIVGKSKVQ